METESALGTAHIALGNSIAYGGIVPAVAHLDCVMRDATLTLDGVARRRCLGIMAVTAPGQAGPDVHLIVVIGWTPRATPGATSPRAARTPGRSPRRDCVVVASLTS